MDAVGFFPQPSEVTGEVALPPGRLHRGHDRSHLLEMATAAQDMIENQERLSFAAYIKGVTRRAVSTGGASSPSDLRSLRYPAGLATPVSENSQQKPHFRRVRSRPRLPFGGPFRRLNHSHPAGDLCAVERDEQFDDRPVDTRQLQRGCDVQEVARAREKSKQVDNSRTCRSCWWHAMEPN